MAVGHVHVSNLIPASRAEVYKYLTDVRKLISDLEPGIELSFALVDGDPVAASPLGFPKIQAQAEIPIAIRRMGLAAHGMIRIEKANAPVEIAYCQEAGWFRSWRHTIRLEDHGDGKSTLMTDLVDYRLPFGVFGTLADDLFFKRNLSATLNDRAARIVAHFESIPTLDTLNTPDERELSVAQSIEQSAAGATADSAKAKTLSESHL